MSTPAPYIFISYAHKDKRKLMPVIMELEERGYKVWYDAGIEVGSEWPRIIAERLSACTLMIAYVTENYVVSDNCLRELTYAQNKKKSILTVFDGIDRDSLPLGIDMQLGLEQSIDRSDYNTAEEFVNAISASSIIRDSGILPKEKLEEQPVATHKGRTLFLSVLMILLEIFSLPFIYNAFERMIPDYGLDFLYAFAFILLPEIGLMLVGIILVRIFGKKLVDDERYFVAGAQLLAMIVIGVIAISNGMPRMSPDLGGFAKFVIAFLSVVVTDFIKLVPIAYSTTKF